jgi:hypothetical protein
MTRRWIIAGFVLAALGLLAYYIAQVTTWREVTIPTPLRGEAAVNPFYAAGELVDELGGVATWRRDLNEMPDPSSVLVISGMHWDVSDARRRRIERWVESGGRLVVDGTLLGVDALESWAGLRSDYFETEARETEESVSDTEGDAQPAERAGEAVVTDTGAETNENTKDHDDTSRDDESPAGPTAGCHQFRHAPIAADRAVPREWTYCEAQDAQRFVASGRVSWGLRDEFGYVAARLPKGRGSVGLVQGEPFSWREVQRVDHALVLLEAMQFRRGDRVLFLSADREQSLLELAWRHGWPVVCVGLLAALLALWRAGARFGPPVPEPDAARRSLGEQILGTGRFIMRSGGTRTLHTAALKATDDLAQRRLRNYARLDEAGRCRALAEASGIEVAKIHAARDWARTARSHELPAAIACLESVRRVLARQKFTERKSA